MRLFEMRGQPRLRRLASRLCASLGLLSVLVCFSHAQQLTTRAQLNAIIGVGAGCDDFETLNMSGTFQALTTATLSSATVVGTQTNLVQPGAKYVSKLGNIAWLNNGFMGVSKRIWANGSIGLDIVYTSPVRAMGLDFYVHSSFSGNITAKVHTVSAGIITVSFSYNASQTPFFFGYAHASGITKVELFDNNGNAAVSIDNHCYGCPPNVWWCEDWTPYPYGPFQGPAGGWHPWTSGSTTEFGIVQDNWCSPPKAFNILTDTDMVHEFTCIDNGKWIFSADWWIPAGNNQRSYILLMNKYPAGTATEWSVQIGGNSTNVTYIPAGTLQAPVIVTPVTTKTNQYVNLCVEIDFTASPNGSVNVYYDYQPIVLGAPWKSETTSLMQLAAIDLYGGNLGGTSWVDDLAIVRNCPRVYTKDIADNFNSGFFSWLLNYKRPAFQTAFSPNRGFDDAGIDKLFGTSFANLPKGNCLNFKGDLFMRAAPINLLAGGDFLRLGWNGGTSWTYSTTLAAQTSTVWTAPPVPPTNITMNLGRTPTSGPTLLQHINANGYLDILNGWMTKFDWMRLRLWNCRPWWRGFSWGPLDPGVSATLGPNGVINVAVPGGSGAIAQDLGDSGGFVARYADQPDLKGSAVRHCEFVYGNLNNEPEQQIGRLWTVGNGSQAQLNADFSTTGATTAHVRLYRPDGSMAGEGDRPNGLMALLLPSFAGQAINIAEASFNCWSDTRSMIPDVWIIRFPIPINVSLNGNTITNVGSMKIAGVGASVPRGPIVSHVIDVDGIPSYSIVDAGSQMFGLQTSTQGNAVVNASQGELGVSNFGTSISDGVSFDLGKADKWEIDFDAERAGPMAINDCGIGRSYGWLNGVANSQLGMVMSTRTAAGYELSADYSSVGSPTVRIRLMNGSTVLADLPGHAPVVGVADSMPRLCGKGNPGGLPCFFWEWQTPTLFQVAGGGSHLIDRIELLAEPPSGTSVGPYSRAEFLGVNLVEATITDVRSYRTISGHVDLLDLSGAPAGQGIVVEVRLRGSTTPVTSSVINLGSSGEFSIVTDAQGEIDVAIKASHWLRKREAAFLEGESLNLGNFALTNGDCDNDNENGIGDYALLSASYNKCEGDPGFDSRTDLNGDGCTDIGDYAVLSANYGLFGDD